MNFTSKMTEVLIIWNYLLAVILGIIGIINYVLFIKYLEKNHFTLLKKLENKKSIIKLPTIINLDPYFFKYVFTIQKSDDYKIKIHKIIYQICLIGVIILLIYTLFIQNSP